MTATGSRGRHALLISLIPLSVSLHALEKHAALAAAESAARMIGERHLVSCAPNLCIAFRNGKAQLMRGIQDDQPSKQP